MMIVFKKTVRGQVLMIPAPMFRKTKEEDFYSVQRKEMIAALRTIVQKLLLIQYLILSKLRHANISWQTWKVPPLLNPPNYHI